MKENKYDDPRFFQAYGEMTRSKYGLRGAGEWSALRGLLPDFRNKRVLDLGCGYGWHCIYAAEHGAGQVLGIDLSRRMLETARENTPPPASPTGSAPWRIWTCPKIPSTWYSVPWPSTMSGISTR